MAFLSGWLIKQMQEVAGERGGYLHGRGGNFFACVAYTYSMIKTKTDYHFQPFRGFLALPLQVSAFKGLASKICFEFHDAALDSDDLLYLKEQMEAEEDAERLLRRTEKRAFTAFKRAASLADSTLAPVPLILRVESKPKSGIRQQDLLKKVVGIKPKRPRLSSPSEDIQPSIAIHETASSKQEHEEAKQGEKHSHSTSNDETAAGAGDTAKSLLGLAYESSDSED